jgi:hypothetical protein
MAINDDDDDFAVDSIEPAARDDGKAGPPDDWPRPSWFDVGEVDWYWNGKPDPCPVKPLGQAGGIYVFVTAGGEIRKFTSGQLHGRGGLTDLFAGSLWWPLKHFRKWDVEKRQHTGGLREKDCIRALIRACHLTGYYDGSTPHRSVGTWRGPDGRPIVHAGDRIFESDDAGGGIVHGPGVEIGDAIYVIGGSRQAPAYINESHPRALHNGFAWDPARVDAGHRIARHLDEWHWLNDEARDLFMGGLFCDMLGDAPLWRPHKFVRAPAGSGKSTLLKYARALLGGAAHPIQRSYSKAFLEQMFSGTSSALLLDEMESDEAADRVRHLFELVRLLSDDGASGGRGTSGGQARQFDIHGTVTMVATVTEAWRPQDRSRIVFLELRPLADRPDHPPAPPESMAALIEDAAALSASVRARAICRFDLFLENLAIARAAILALGGSQRDGDQLGHLIAGWATLTSDQPLSEDEAGGLGRFRDYVLTLTDAEDQADDPGECFNLLLGLQAQVYRSGEQLTVGQMIARARNSQDGADMRRAMLPLGMRLDKLEGEPWELAWLAVANKHPGLDRLFADYPQYRGPKRQQILAGLRRSVPQPGGGVEILEAKPSGGALRFAGPQSRALLIPPGLLPSEGDDA